MGETSAAGAEGKRGLCLPIPVIPAEVVVHPATQRTEPQAMMIDGKCRYKRRSRIAPATTAQPLGYFKPHQAGLARVT